MSKTFAAVSAIPNAHEPHEGLTVGGQPTAAQVQAFADAGGKVVLDVRDPMEQRPFAEEDTITTLGLEYHNVSVVPGGTSDEKMEAVLTVLRNHEAGAVLFHCASGNRCGGPTIAHLMLDHGMTEEDAVQHAMRGGLRSPEYLQWGLDYVARHMS